MGHRTLLVAVTEVPGTDNTHSKTLSIIWLLVFLLNAGHIVVMAPVSRAHPVVKARLNSNVMTPRRDRRLCSAVRVKKNLPATILPYFLNNVSLFLSLFSTTTPLPHPPTPQLPPQKTATPTTSFLPHVVAHTTGALCPPLYAFQPIMFSFSAHLSWHTCAHTHTHRRC